MHSNITVVHKQTHKNLLKPQGCLGRVPYRAVTGRREQTKPNANTPRPTIVATESLRFLPRLPQINDISIFLYRFLCPHTSPIQRKGWHCPSHGVCCAGQRRESQSAPPPPPAPPGGRGRMPTWAWATAAHPLLSGCEGGHQYRGKGPIQGLL